VGDGFHEISDFNFDPEFFHQLSMQRLFEGFRRLPLAAGEFPQPGEMSASWTLSDEELAVTEYEGCGNFNGLHEVPE